MTASLRRVVRTLVAPVDRMLPERYRLSYEVLRLRATMRLEQELRSLESLAGRGDVALDIGANRGYYTYHLARLFRSVLAFEPNASVLRALRAWRAPNVEIHDVALSRTAGELELYVPLVGGVRQHGWASFDRDNLAGASEFEVIRVPVRPLDDYGLRSVSFVKVDVEGHEPAVLAGATETIERNRPVVLMEVKEKNRPEVFPFFEAREYRRHRFVGGCLVPDESPACDPADGSENYVFKPR